jgi:hypothetical protein
MPSGITVNRAPVMTLWAAVVAERLGHPSQEALTIGKAVAGAIAQRKGRRLGIYEEKTDKPPLDVPPSNHQSEVHSVTTILGRDVSLIQTPEGLRAAAKGKPIDPASVDRYLEKAFGDDLGEVRSTMLALARAYPPSRLSALAYELYEQFRPSIPSGSRGWGARGLLRLDLIRQLTGDARQ